MAKKKINIFGAIQKATPKIDFIKGSKKIASSPAIMGLLKTGASFIPGVGGLVSAGLGKIQSSATAQKLISAGKQIQDISRLVGTSPSQTVKDMIAEKVQYGTSKIANIVPTHSIENEKSNQDTALPLPLDMIKSAIKKEKSYSLFSDFSRDAVTDSEILKIEREKTISLLDKNKRMIFSLAEMSNSTLKKADVDFSIRMKGLLKSAFTQFQNIAEAVGRPVNMLDRASFLLKMTLGDDVKLSGGIPQAISLNKNIQLQLENLYNNDLMAIQNSIDNFFKSGTKKGESVYIAPKTSGGIVPQNTQTPVYVEPKKDTLKDVASMLPILALAGAGLYVLSKRKKK